MISDSSQQVNAHCMQQQSSNKRWLVKPETGVAFDRFRAAVAPCILVVAVLLTAPLPRVSLTARCLRCASAVCLCCADVALPRDSDGTVAAAPVALVAVAVFLLRFAFGAVDFAFALFAVTSTKQHQYILRNSQTQTFGYASRPAQFQSTVSFVATFAFGEPCLLSTQTSCLNHWDKRKKQRIDPPTCTHMETHSGRCSLHSERDRRCSVDLIVWMLSDPRCG